MPTEQILQRIHHILTQELGIADADDIDTETNLITSGYLDSINAMRLVSQIESDFATKIPPRDLVPANFLTIGTIANYLAKKNE